jgi:hypothetical protein
MNKDQFKRASEIAERAKYLANKRDILKTIEDRGITNFEIKTFEGGTVSFKVHNNINHEDAIQHQPASIDILTKAFVQTSISVYQQEIDKLEKEFNSL